MSCVFRDIRSFCLCVCSVTSSNVFRFGCGGFLPSCRFFPSDGGLSLHLRFPSFGGILFARSCSGGVVVGTATLAGMKSNFLNPFGVVLNALKASWIVKLAAVFVGIGGLIGDAKASSDCDPPVYDVCFHKEDGDWTTVSTAAMLVKFSRIPGRDYVYRFQGLMQNFSGSGDWWIARGSDKGSFSGSFSLECNRFWWDPDRGGTGGTLSIHEAGDSSSWTRDGPRVLGKWVALVHFYPYQEAALVYLNTSAVPGSFDHDMYYCTIDWDGPIQLRHGYTEGYWAHSIAWDPRWPWYRPWLYHGDPGTPRQPYNQRCLIAVYPPARTPGNTRP